MKQAQLSLTQTLQKVIQNVDGKIIEGGFDLNNE